MDRRVFVKAGLTAGAATALGSAAAVAHRPFPRRATPLRLNANENPLGLSPAARRAVIDAIPDANRYPFEGHERVVAALAESLGVKAEQVVLGNGSTEILQMAVQVWGRTGARFIIADPTFEDVPDYAAPWNLDVVKVPLRADYSHDLERMGAVASQANGGALVYICNPNNPTGTLTPSAEVDAWIESASDQVTFLIDEAYFEYADAAPSYWSAVKWLDTRPNVVVVRTFSKIFGMAGMRLGYAIAHPETAARLRALAAFTNANHLACMAALASLEDPTLVSRSLAVNTRARDLVTSVLDELELAYLPSHTNFLMHRIRGELDAYRARMEEAGYLVGRPFPPMLEYNRLSLGLPEEMEEFGATLRTFRERDWV